MVNGATALLDAVGVALVYTRRFIQALPSESAPQDVVVAILTDGEENSSRTYKPSDISSLITDLTQEAGWRILFLGADIDVWTVGRELGVPQDTTARYSSTGIGTHKAFSDISDFVTLKRPERRLRRRQDDPEDGGSGQVH